MRDSDGQRAARLMRRRRSAASASECVGCSRVPRQVRLAREEILAQTSANGAAIYAVGQSVDELSADVFQLGERLNVVQQQLSARSMYRRYALLCVDSRARRGRCCGVCLGRLALSF